MSYTPGNTKKAMGIDDTGVDLFMRIDAVARRDCNSDRIIKDFKHNREAHDKMCPPDDVCLSWVVVNTMADCLATYIETSLDEKAY